MYKTSPPSLLSPSLVSLLGSKTNQSENRIVYNWPITDLKTDNMARRFSPIMTPCLKENIKQNQRLSNKFNDPSPHMSHIKDKFYINILCLEIITTIKISFVGKHTIQIKYYDKKKRYKLILRIQNIKLLMW